MASQSTARALKRLSHDIDADCSLDREQKQGEKVIGITTDPINHTYWAHTTQALYEVVPNEEDRDIWRARLEQGDFDAALKHAKVRLHSPRNPPQLITMRP